MLNFLSSFYNYISIVVRIDQYNIYDYDFIILILASDSQLIIIFQIDLDTIDVSNLNRQFLFQKKHVGKSKASIACETALTFNPDVKMIHYHDSITS